MKSISTDSREYPLAEILRIRNLPCDVQFSQKSQYNLVSVEGTNMATANVRIRLLRTYDELYLVGSPMTESKCPLYRYQTFVYVQGRWLLCQLKEKWVIKRYLCM